MVATTKASGHASSWVWSGPSADAGEDAVDVEMPANLQSLSDRERECLTHVAAGLTNKEIGARLQLSSRTVEIHILHPCKQLQARNRVHAVAVALRHKLLDVVDSGPNADKS